MKLYILDSNIFIGFYDRYYRYEYFPTFLEKLVDILNNHVVIPKVILNENYPDPWFKEWLKKHYTTDFLEHRDYLSEWIFVLEHIKNSDLYKDDAIINSEKGWGNEKIADPWLIAIAQKENYILVTQETRNVNLNKYQPTKSAKIPDICDDLNIECIDMNSFFKEINLHI